MVGLHQAKIAFMYDLQTVCFMKKNVCLLILFIAGVQAWPCSILYTITKNVYFGCTYFEMDGKDQYEGRVAKNHFSLRSIYDLYDPLGKYEAQGICRLLSLGALAASFGEIDVYDASGALIGFIEGRLWTVSAAKFSFYNSFNEPIANAYLDWNCSSFTIISLNGQTIARLKRIFVRDDIDHWEVAIYKPELLDARVIKVFSSYTIDKHGYFKEDI